MFSNIKEGIKAIIDPIRQVPIVIAIGKLNNFKNFDKQTI